MLPPVSQRGPVNLELLNEYLMSDRAPAECMDVSQLDGFLAGVVVGPEMIVPSEFLPVVWGGAQPEFADPVEAEAVLGSILGRYNEIAESLDATPPRYAPVFWQDQAGNSITEDWAVGFMQAVALRSDAWEPALFDDETAMLLIPIGIIAGLSEPKIGLNDAALSDEFLDELMERAADLLPGCVHGLRTFWLARDVNAAMADRPAGSQRWH
jgi:uncharacterized protein